MDAFRAHFSQVLDDPLVAAEGGRLVEDEDGLDGAAPGMAGGAGAQRRERLGDERLDELLVAARCRG